MQPTPKIKQADIPPLVKATQSVLDGGDPLEFVNAFFRCPGEAEPFPSGGYWEKRICAVAEILYRIGDDARRSG